MTDLLTRLREQFEAQYEVQGKDECWIWTGPRYKNTGYGRMRILGGMVYAHRFAYELYIGPVPEGLVLDHYICDTRACANPEHLKPVTSRENILRGIGLTAVNARKTHCLRGHLLEGDNVYLNSGRRHCRECARTRARKNQAAARRRAGIPMRKAVA